MKEHKQLPGRWFERSDCGRRHAEAELQDLESSAALAEPLSFGGQPPRARPRSSFARCGSWSTAPKARVVKHESCSMQSQEVKTLLQAGHIFA